MELIDGLARIGILISRVFHKLFFVAILSKLFTREGQLTSITDDI